MRDIDCQCLVSLLGKHTAYLGEPRKLTFYNPDFPRVEIKNRRAEAGLYEHPRLGGGHDLYFIASWPLDGSAQRHTHTLYSNEDTPGTVRWIGPAPCYASFAGETCISISLSLTQKWMDSLHRSFGDPWGEGQWIAERFLPRRRGASIRMIDPLFVQLWIRMNP